MLGSFLRVPKKTTRFAFLHTFYPKFSIFSHRYICHICVYDDQNDDKSDNKGDDEYDDDDDDGDHDDDDNDDDDSFWS